MTPASTPSDHWNRVYTKRSEDRVSWFQLRPDLSLTLIAEFLDTQSSVIDVGGGASRLVDNLVEAGYRHVSVLDVAGAALERTRARLQSVSDRVDWIEGDVRYFRPEQRWDLWHDRAVFHFMTNPEDRRGYLEAVNSGLRVGGCAIIATFALDGPERCSGLDVCRYDAGGLQSTFGDDYELLRSEHEMHSTPDGVQQSFLYAVLRRRG